MWGVEWLLVRVFGTLMGMFAGTGVQGLLVRYLGCWVGGNWRVGMFDCGQ